MRSNERPRGSAEAAGGVFVRGRSGPGNCGTVLRGREKFQNLTLVPRRHNSRQFATSPVQGPSNRQINFACVCFPGKKILVSALAACLNSGSGKSFQKMRIEGRTRIMLSYVRDVL